MATCSEHHGQPFVMVCYSCDKCYSLVYCECIARKHKGHDLETFETAAKTVLDRLRTEKAKISTNMKEIHVDLKNYATIQENERKISENTRQYINRRRELLKLAIDEAAEILLEKQESSDKKIMDALLYGKQQAEDKVRNFLEFQSKLAMLETSTDYQQVIQVGKQMFFPNISKTLCPIPAVTRHTLRCQKTVDRRLVRELFGEELQQDIRGSYILHCFEGKEGSDTESISTTDLFEEEMAEHEDDSVDSQDAESDGNVGNRQIDHPNASHRQEIPHTSPMTPNDNHTTRSRNPETYGVAYPNVFGETFVFSVPQGKKLEPQASTARTSEREPKTIQLPEENISHVSDNFAIKTCTHQSKSVLQSKISEEYYV